MKSKMFMSLISIAIIGMLMSACIPSQLSGLGGGDADQEATAAQQTLVAMQTQSWIDSLEAELTRVVGIQPGIGTPIVYTSTSVPTEAIATLLPTPTLVPPTATMLPPTATMVPPTATSIPPTPTPVPCYWAQFVQDINVPDGGDITAGTTFTKTWRLKNIGTCAWSTDFDLIFVSGNVMSAPAVIDLTTTVRPGETVDLSVSMIAPTKAGTYTGNWQLRSGNGVLFGLGNAQNKPFWVTIDVPADIVVLDPNSPLNFASSYQSATWNTPKGSPSSSDDFTKGSVYTASKPRMEKDRTDDELALIMIPSDGDGGQIYGDYPAVNIKAGDRLKGIIGCTADSPDCNVMFVINYRADGGSTTTLRSWTEVYDGNWTYLDLDLSSLAGKSVRFTLQVLNNGNSKNDRVFWLAPKIVRP